MAGFKTHSTTLLFSVALLGLGGCELSDKQIGDDELGSDDGSDSDDGPTLPPGCEDLFDDADLTCSDSEAICSAVTGDPSRVLRWDVQFDEDLSGSGEPSDKVSDYAHKAECVEQFLDDRGLSPISGPIDDVYFFVEAPLEILEPLCRASMIGHCGPYARDEDCLVHDEAGCEGDPLCWSYTGVPLDAARTCREALAFARCFSHEIICDDMPVIAERDDETCWMLSGSCLNELDTDWTLPGTCPAPAEFEALPACG